MFKEYYEQSFEELTNHSLVINVGQNSMKLSNLQLKLKVFKREKYFLDVFSKG